MSPNSSLSRLSKRRVCLGITPCLVSHQFLSALCFYFQIQSSVAWLLSACSYCSHRLWSTELSKWMRSAQDMLWKHWVCRLGKSNPVPGRENTLGQTETVGWSRRLKLLECRNTRVGWQNLMLRQSLSSLLCRVERGTGTCLAGELGISHLFPALVAALEVPHIYPCKKFTICVCILLLSLEFCTNPSVITLPFHPHYDLPFFALWSVLIKA